MPTKNIETLSVGIESQQRNGRQSVFRRFQSISHCAACASDRAKPPQTKSCGNEKGKPGGFPFY